MRALLGAMALAGLLAIAGAAPANDPPTMPPPAMKSATLHFPQPVRVGDLANRYVLQPDEAQQVLGRVARVIRTATGTPQLVIRRGGFFGLGSTVVAVPSDDLALLGEHVVLVGMTPAAFDALPPFQGGEATTLAADRTIEMGIVGPYH